MTRRDERGAVAAITAIMLAVIVTMAAFAVDLGMQRVVRSDMQALADVVALDAARLLDGRDAGEIRAPVDGTPSLDETVAASAARHSTLGDVDEVTAHLVYLAEGAHGAQEPRRDLDGGLVPVPDNEVPEAVYVVASGSVDFSFAPGSGGATRTALGIASSAACFTLGSYAASIEPGAAPMYDELLKRLLGANTLGLAGYDGLATAGVSLLDIVSAPSISVGTVDELLSAPDITVADFYLAMAHALRGEGQVAQAEVLESAATSLVAAVTIDLGDLFGLTTASDAALDTRFNVLDLLVGGALLADGDHLSTEQLQAGLPLGSSDTELTIIERPQRACNEDEAQTAQIRLTTLIQQNPSNQPLINTPALSLRMVDPATGSPSNDLVWQFNGFLAGARATLASVSCDPDKFTATVTTDLVTLRLEGSMHIRGTATVEIQVGITPPVEVEVPVRFDVDLVADGSRPASAPQTVVFEVPPQAYGDSVGAGGGAPALPALSITVDVSSLQTGPVQLAGVPVDTAVLDQAVTPLLAGVPTLVSDRISPAANELVAKLNEYLSQLATGAGLSLAGADFFGLERPLCNSPRLRG